MIQSLFRSLHSWFTRNRVMTSPDSADKRLTGRTYAIPFEAVWQASLGLTDGGLRGWSLLESDDHEGLIRAAVRGRIERLESAVALRVTLDTDAQTRVDATSASLAVRGDMGVNARRLGRFFRRLDQVLDADSKGARIAPVPRREVPGQSWS